MAGLALGISGRLEEGEVLQAWVLGSATGLQWQALVGGTWVDVGLANSQTYTVPAGAAGTAYRLVGTSADGTFYSDPTGAAVVDTRKATAPVLAGAAQASLATEHVTDLSLFHWLTFTDSDKGNYGGGSLLLQNSNSLLRGGDGHDVMSIRFAGTQAGQFSFNAATREVRYAFTNGNAVTVATIDAALAGNGTDLKLVFTVNATAAVVNALTDNLTFSNQDDSPAAARLFTLRITDPAGASAQRVTSVSIANTADAPLFTNAASATVGENQADVLTVAALDPDREAGDPQGISYSLAAGTGDADNGRFEIDAVTGALRFTAAPDYEDPQHGSAYSVRVRATDSQGSTMDQVIAIAVRDVNEAPVANDWMIFTQEDAPAVSFLPQFSDPDANETLTVTFDATGTLGNVSFDGSRFTYDAAGHFQQLGAYSFGSDTFTYTVTDAAGLSTTRTVTMQIRGENDAAVITGTSTAAMQEDVDVDFVGQLATSGKLDVTDIDQGEASFMPALGTGSANIGRFFISGDGRWTYTADNSRVQSLGAGETRVDTFTARSFDGSMTQQLQVTMHGANDAPVASAASDLAGTVREPQAGTGVLAIDMGSEYDQPIIRADNAGGLLVLGFRHEPTGESTPVVERHLADGSIDGSFGTAGRATLPASFSPGGLTLDGAGGAIAVGRTSADYGQTRTDWAICRFNADGSPVAGFGNGGVVTLDFNGGYDDARQATVDGSGRIVVTGSSSAAGITVARLHQDGSLDGSFGNAGLLTIDAGEAMTDVSMDSQGRFVAWGSATDPSTGQASFCVARFLADGSLDAGFGQGGRAYVPPLGDTTGGLMLALASDGSLVLGWSAFEGNWAYTPVQLVRLDANGSPVAGFGQDGRVDTGLGVDDGLSLAVDAQGRVLVAVDNVAGDVQLARFNADGALDATFGSGGVASADFGADDWLSGMQLLPNGDILLGGTTWGSAGGDGAAARFDMQGNLDPLFGAPPTGAVTAMGNLYAADVDAGDPLQWSGNAAGTYGTFQVSAAGAWTYVLDTTDPDTQALAEGQTVTETFASTVTDSHGATATQEVVVTVVGSQEMPIP